VDTLVYDPLAHWMWADGGGCRKLGALDFAGGIVVHVSSGFSALVFGSGPGQAAGLSARAHLCPTTWTMVLLGRRPALVRLVWFNGAAPWPLRAWPRWLLVNSQLAAAMGGMVWLVVDIARLWQGVGFGLCLGLQSRAWPR